MQKRRQFSTSIDIAAPSEKVISFLADLRNLRELHPLIESVRLIEGSSKYLRSYSITDRLQFLCFPMRFNYDAHILEEAPNRLKALTNPGFGIEIQTKYQTE